MKFRQHRGNLDASMATVVEIEPTEQALRAHLERTRANERQSRFERLVDVGKLEVKPYGQIGAPLPDKRIAWSATYVVTENGNAIGFTDEPLIEEPVAEKSEVDKILESIPKLGLLGGGHGLPSDSATIYNAAEALAKEVIRLRALSSVQTSGVMEQVIKPSVTVERRTFYLTSLEENVYSQLQTYLQTLIDNARTIMTAQQIDVHHISPGATDTYITKATFLVIYR